MIPFLLCRDVCRAAWSHGTGCAGAGAADGRQLVDGGAHLRRGQGDLLQRVPRWRQDLFDARQSRRSGHHSAEPSSRPARRTLRKHHRHHRGGRQDSGRRPSRPRPALRWRPVGVALERRREDVVRREERSTTSPAPPPKVCTRSPPTEKARSSPRGSTSAAPKARSCTPPARWTTAPHGRRTSRSINRPAAASANAATPRWRSTLPAGSW